VCATLSEVPAEVVSMVSWRERIRGWGLSWRAQASGPMMAVVWRLRREIMSKCLVGWGGVGIVDGASGVGGSNVLEMAEEGGGLVVLLLLIV